jgi:NifU-like protein involved in Fe-S cluster formation
MWHENREVGRGIGLYHALSFAMADLDEIYNTKLLELAAHIPRSERLKAPDATATAHSKLCGSTVSIDLSMRDDRVTDFGQTVKACLLGQATCAVVGENIIGATSQEVHEASAAMRRMLKEQGPPPTGRFADLVLLEPVRHYKARHGSVMLVFEALEQAIAEIEGREEKRGGEPSLRQTSGEPHL